jgi:hypothetical protein
MKTKNKRSSSAKLIGNDLKNELAHNDIAFAAYCLWEHEGRPQGHDWEHWFRAERLMQQTSKRNCVQAQGS